MVLRVGKKLWKGEEEVKLSKLLLAFWQRHGCLPAARAYGFWKSVKDRLAQRFTIKQIQRKVVSLRKRYLNIISGIAREVKQSEAETLPIWEKMLNRTVLCHAEEEEAEDEAEGALPHGGGGYNMQPQVNEQGDQAASDDPLAAFYEHPTFRTRMEVSGAAAMEDVNLPERLTDEEDSSCCIIEEEEDPDEVEEVEEEEDYMEVPEEQQQEPGFNGEAQEGGEEEEEDDEEEQQEEAAQHEAAHNNFHAFRQEGASSASHTDKQELKMLNCIAIADLASAVRTLAEVIRAPRKPIPV